MTQLTKEYLDEALKSLATKKNLDSTNKILAKTNETLAQVNVTVQNTAGVVAGLVVDVGMLKEDMASVKATQETHTRILDAITKRLESWNAEAAALRSAIQRHEHWIAKLADKLGLKLEE